MQDIFTRKSQWTSLLHEFLVIFKIYSANNYNINQYLVSDTKNFSHFTTEETFTLLYRVVRVVVPHASARQSKLIATNIAYAWVTCRNMSNWVWEQQRPT